MNYRIDYIGDQGWGLFIAGSPAIFFETKMEALEMAAKLETVMAIVRCVQSLADATDKADDLVQEYFDVGTGSLTDEELGAIGMTVATMTACVTLLQQFSRFMRDPALNVDPEFLIDAKYVTTLNQVRRMKA